VIQLARIVTEDTVLGGAAMKAGGKVMVLYAAANLDDDAFPQADQLLLDRTGNRHLAFGDGIHADWFAVPDV
jgi:cytochrome P450